MKETFPRALLALTLATLIGPPSCDCADVGEPSGDECGVEPPGCDSLPVFVPDNPRPNPEDAGPAGVSSDQDPPGDDDPGVEPPPTDPDPGPDPDEADDGASNAPDDAADDVADAGVPEADACEPSAERCSFVDESCDGQNNEGLDCTFLASSEDALWRVDPFTGVVAHVQDVSLPGIEVLFDVAEAPGGELYATAGRKLYRIDDDGAQLALENNGAQPSAIPFNPNGLAIGYDGAVFISSHDTFVGSKVVQSQSVDELPAFLGSLSPFHSAGDCVINKGALLVAVDGAAEGASDILVELPLGGGAPIVLGELGYDGVHGLSEAFDLLFAVTASGEVLLVDEGDGSTTLLFDVDIDFTGAASLR
jgi:hypothetical protein